MPVTLGTSTDEDAMEQNWWIILDYPDGQFQPFGRVNSPDVGFESRDEAATYAHYLFHANLLAGVPGSVVYLGPQSRALLHAMGQNHNARQ